MKNDSYFSINISLLPMQTELGFDIHVNSSTLELKPHFVRLIAANRELEKMELAQLQEKYPQFYVRERDRQRYYQLLAKYHQQDITKVIDSLKLEAIQYLEDIYQNRKLETEEDLALLLEDCQAVISGMVSVLKDQDVESFQSLLGELSQHDFYTYDHSINVSMYSIMLLKEVKKNVSDHELEVMGIGALLHDLGKAKISNEILNKPEGLSEDEYNEIKKHPAFGVRMILEKIGYIDGFTTSDIDTIARIIGEHHENINGTGYPQGLTDEQINFHAKVCAIVDFYDAITTKRSYSQTLTTKEALALMEKTVDKKIDRQIFQCLKDCFKKTLGKDNIIHNFSTMEKQMEEKFDPTVPWRKLPIKRVNKKDE